MLGQSLLMHLLLAVCLLSPVTSPQKTIDTKVLLSRVYARLLQTIGNPANAPILQLVPHVAGQATGKLVYWSDPARIEIGQDVVALCATFGHDADAALACLLGHELAHFQYRHKSKQGFFSPVVIENGQPGSSENLEALADRSGIFMAYLAGYDAFSVAPAVYTAFYKTFNKPDQIPGYPTKLRRLRMVADTTARVQELAQLFEIGEISYLLRDYEAAAQAFETLLTRYPNSTTRNNLGAAKLNLALNSMPLSKDSLRLRFAFPVEFDCDNRLLDSRRRGKSEAEYKKWLIEAQYLFKNALSEQPTHQAARLNLAIAEYLLGDSKQAHQTLLNFPSPLSANAYLMLGIVLADLGQREAAENSFKLALAKGAFRAAENIKYFEEGQKPGWKQWLDGLMGKQQQKQKPVTSFPIWPDRMIPSQLPAKVVLLGGIHVARTDSLTSYQLPITGTKPTEHYQVLKSSRLKLKGLPIGSPSKLLTQYAPPATIIAGARGTVFYGFRKINKWLFLEYRDNQLQSWVAVEKIIR